MFSSSFICKLKYTHFSVVFWCCFFSLSFWQKTDKVPTASNWQAKQRRHHGLPPSCQCLWKANCKLLSMVQPQQKRGKVASSAHLIPWKKVYSDFWNGFFKFSTKTQQLSTFSKLIFLIPRNIHLGVVRLIWKI